MTGSATIPTALGRQRWFGYLRLNLVAASPYERRVALWVRLTRTLPRRDLECRDSRSQVGRNNEGILDRCFPCNLTASDIDGAIQHFAVEPRRRCFLEHVHVFLNQPLS